MLHFQSADPLACMLMNQHTGRNFGLAHLPNYHPAEAAHLSQPKLYLPYPTAVLSIELARAEDLLLGCPRFVEELLGAQDGCYLCLETALAAGDGQQIPASLVGAQWLHLLICVQPLQCHSVQFSVTQFNNTVAHCSVARACPCKTAGCQAASGMSVRISLASVSAGVARDDVKSAGDT